MNAVDDALFDTTYGQHLQGKQPPDLDGQDITAGENDEDDALFNDDEAQEETSMVEEEPPAERSLRWLRRSLHRLRRSRLLTRDRSRQAHTEPNLGDA